MTFDYDLFVIGGGSGGVRAARVAAGEHGAKVGLSEEYRMGGTCVIRGCVPKKLMVFASHYSQMTREAVDYGWQISAGAFDWPHFREHLQSELSRLEAVYRKNLATAGVEIFDTRAVLDDAHTVRLASGETLTAKHVLIATGGHPVLPPQVAQAGLGITSNEIFQLDRLPERMLIVGGGYIACEFACIMNGLGSTVTQYHRRGQILRGFDDEVAGHIMEQLREDGIDLHVGTDVTEIARRDDGLWVKASNGREAVFDDVLFATGRRPNTEGLGLEEAGVKLGKGGEVLVDDYSQSSVPSIFAVGDVTDRLALTPVAIREGHAFADTVFGGAKRAMDHDWVPSAVFTQPEMGTVGLTEDAAAENHRIEVFCTTFQAMRTAFVGHRGRVLFKLVVDADTRRVLGCHIVADGAGELIQLAGVAIKMGATKEDFDRTVAVHPTASEEIVTMRTPVRTA